MLSSIGDLAPVLVGVSGFVTAVFTGYKSYQSQQNKQKESANEAVVKNFQLLFNEQKDRTNELSEEIKTIKKDQSAERLQWATERTQLQSRIDTLIEQNVKKDEKIAEMNGMIQVLQKKVN